MKTSTEALSIELGEYIVESSATVRSAAKKLGISKSAVHTFTTKAERFCWGEQLNTA